MITAAKLGATAIGIEYNPDMVELSKKNAAKAGASAAKASFVKADLFETDFSKATVLTMFLLPGINIKLRPKILSMKPGTRVVSNSFTMEDWEADETETVSNECTAGLLRISGSSRRKSRAPGQMPQGDLKLTQPYQKLSGTLGTPRSRARWLGDRITFTAGKISYTGPRERQLNWGPSYSSAWTATKR